MNRREERTSEGGLEGECGHPASERRKYFAGVERAEEDERFESEVDRFLVRFVHEVQVFKVLGQASELE